jgi:hypothetical protein
VSRPDALDDIATASPTRVDLHAPDDGEAVARIAQDVEVATRRPTDPGAQSHSPNSSTDAISHRCTANKSASVPARPGDFAAWRHRGACASTAQIGSAAIHEQTVVLVTAYGIRRSARLVEMYGWTLQLEYRSTAASRLCSPTGQIVGRNAVGRVRSQFLIRAGLHRAPGKRC